MEDLVQFIVVRNTVNTCHESLKGDMTIEEEYFVLTKCDDIIVSLMYNAILLGRLEDFKYLWDNWVPELELKDMIKFIKADCGGNSQDFLSYLKELYKRII